MTTNRKFKLYSTVLLVLGWGALGINQLFGFNPVVTMLAMGCFTVSAVYHVGSKIRVLQPPKGKYHDYNSCNMCSGVNVVTSETSEAGVISEVATKCADCR